MKRDEIKNQLGDIPKEQLDWLMAENGKDINREKQAAAILQSQIDSLTARLNEANEKLEGYDPEWKTKAAQAQQAADARIAEIEMGCAAERAISGLKFSSESAKKAFLADLTAQKLPLQDGKLLGFEDFAKTYKEADPGAFLPEGGVPRVTAGTSGSPAAPTGRDAANAAFRAIFQKE